MTMSLKICLATSMAFLMAGSLFGQSGEPILNTTYQSAVNPKVRTISHNNPPQVADVQAKPYSILWLGSIEHATQLSTQTGRPILIHFEQPNCRGSIHANQTTFKNPELIQVIYDHFVPVRINVLAKPEVGKKFKITQTPTDIILDNEGEIIYHGITERNAVSYATKLATFATAGDEQEASLNIDVGFEVDTVDFNGPQTMDSEIAPANYPQVTQTQPNYQAAPAQPQYRRQYPVQQNQSQTQVPVQQQGNYTPQPSVRQVPLPQQGQPLPTTFPQARTQHEYQLPTQSRQNVHQPPTAGQLQPPLVQIPDRQPNQPKLGLDGYCPVSLSDLNSEGAKWIKGDPQYGIIHRGRIYLFAGKNQLDVFKKFPDRLAPVISGYDPVIFADRQQLVDGARELGVSYKGQVYLFSNKQSLQQFWTAPDRYATNIKAAMQRTR